MSTEALHPPWDVRRGRLFFIDAAVPSPHPPHLHLVCSAFPPVKYNQQILTLLHVTEWQHVTNLPPLAPAPLPLCLGRKSYTRLPGLETSSSFHKRKATCSLRNSLTGLNQAFLGQPPKEKPLIWPIHILQTVHQQLRKYHLQGLSPGLGTTVSCWLQKSFIQKPFFFRTERSREAAGQAQLESDVLRAVSVGFFARCWVWFYFGLVKFWLEFVLALPAHLLCP